MCRKPSINILFSAKDTLASTGKVTGSIVINLTDRGLLEIGRLTGDCHQHIALGKDPDKHSVADDQSGTTVTLAHQLEYPTERG
jgi:hypothetical protein